MIVTELYSKHLAVTFFSNLYPSGRVHKDTKFENQSSRQVPWVPELIFFLSILVVRVSEALSNHKHGLFHTRCFENGPLELGYTAGRVIEKMKKESKNITYILFLLSFLFCGIEGCTDPGLLKIRG